LPIALEHGLAGLLERPTTELYLADIGNSRLTVRLNDDVDIGLLGVLGGEQPVGAGFEDRDPQLIADADHHVARRSANTETTLQHADRKIGNRTRSFRINIDNFEDGCVGTMNIGDRFARLPIDISCQRTSTGNRFTASQACTNDSNNNNYALQIGTPDRNRIWMGV